MDTTDKYIEMCRQLPAEMNSDIIDGDFYYWKLSSQESGKICISYTEDYEEYTVHYPEQWDYLNDREIVKLYRQDQLQDMIKSKYILNWDFYSFVNDGLSHYLDYFRSMEQLWLAFVMQEIHKKRWNGSEWIVI